MIPIHSDLGERGFTLVETMIAVALGLVIMLGAGEIHRGVERSFQMGLHKLVAQQEASLLSTVISRRVRTASGFMVYNVPDRTTALPAGDGLALLGMDGSVTYRFEWNDAIATLADSTGAPVTAMRLQNVQFQTDANFPRTVFYRFQVDDEIGDLVDIESAASLRN